MEMLKHVDVCSPFVVSHRLLSSVHIAGMALGGDSSGNLNYCTTAAAGYYYIGPGSAAEASSAAIAADGLIVWGSTTPGAVYKIPSLGATVLTWTYADANNVIGGVTVSL